MTKIKHKVCGGLITQASREGSLVDLALGPLHFKALPIGGMARGKRVCVYQQIHLPSLRILQYLFIVVGRPMFEWTAAYIVERILDTRQNKGRHLDHTVQVLASKLRSPSHPPLAPGGGPPSGPRLLSWGEDGPPSAPSISKFRGLLRLLCLPFCQNSTPYVTSSLMTSSSLAPHLHNLLLNPGKHWHHASRTSTQHPDETQPGISKAKQKRSPANKRCSFP